MHEYGRGRVTRSLISYSCKLNVRAILATLPEMILQQEERKAYDIYIAECSRMLTENIAKSYGGSYMPKKYIELISLTKENVQDGESIVADVVKRAGLVVI